MVASLPPLAELHGLTRLLARSADRLAARTFAAGRLGPQCLLRLHGVWHDAAEIDWRQLPRRFALKASHGAGSRLVTDQAQTDLEALRAEAVGWLATELNAPPGSPMGPRPRLFAEALLLGRNGAPAPAWRFRLTLGRLESLSDAPPDARVLAAAARLADGLEEARIRLHLVEGQVIFGSIRRD